jgi:hypothetical protein
MAFDCNFCGFRNNEVKGGGAVPTYGTEVTLTVTGPDDLKRYVCMYIHLLRYDDTVATMFLYAVVCESLSLSCCSDMQ